MKKKNILLLWDFIISKLHTFSFQLLPHRVISYGLISISGIFVQLLTTNILMRINKFSFDKAIIFSVLVGATSNYFINNALTYRNYRLKGWAILKGWMRFILIVFLPLSINIGISSIFYKVIAENTFWSQIVGILISFIWNYIASSKLVWNTE